MQIEAVYEHGLLRPVIPLDLPEGERVGISLTTSTIDKAARRLGRAERDAREIEIINLNIDTLNEEALDVLEYQIS